MSKRLLYCFSMLLVLCLSAHAQVPEKVARPHTGKDRVENSGRRLSVMQNAPDRSEKGNEVAPGLRVTENNALISTSKVRQKEIPTAPEGTVTTKRIFGDKIYPSGTGQKSRGLKKVSIDGKLSNVLKSEVRMSYKCFGIKNNTLYAFVWQKDDSGEVSGAWFRTLSLVTYKYTDVDLSEDFENSFIQGGVYIPEENAFYGFGYQCWLKFDVATMTATKLASPAAGTFNTQMTYNTRLRKIVGITAQGDFYEYSKADGSQTLIKSTGVTSPYTAGLCYDILSNNYIWAPNTDSSAELIAFDADTFEPLKICDIEDMAQLGVLFCDESKQNDPAAPRVPEFVSADFPSGSHTGKVEFRLPTLRNDDTPITSPIEYRLYINGIEYSPASGTGNAGESIQLNIGADANLKDGLMVFNLICFLDGHESLDNNTNVYVGHDTPLKPENVTLSFDEISWDPVTAGVHGGYVDTSRIRYNVELNGKLIAENVEGLKCATGLTSDMELAAYVATVYATANGLTSEGGTSNDITFGQPFTEPVYLQPTKSEAKLFTVVDANEDGATWSYNDESGDFRHKYDWDNDGDDWLFMPPVNITNTEYLHKFSMNAWAVDEEVFEVFVGREPSPEAMTQQVIGRSATPGQEIVTPFEGMFDATEAGLYYIGIHAVTPADRLFLHARDMRIEVTNVSKNGPAAVSDVNATAAENGELAAIITFRLPSTSIKGTPLTGSVSATVTGDSDSKSVTGTPGSEQTVKITTAQGDNHLTIQTFQGENPGITHELDIYTGIDKPGMPLNLYAEMQEDNIQGTLHWSAPTTGQNDGFIRQTGITYYLCQKVTTLFGTEEWSVVKEMGTDVFEFPFRVADGTPQQSMALGVAAENEAGLGNVIAVTEFTIGVPYSLPAQETFSSKNQLAYSPVFLKSMGESRVNWSLGDPSALGEQYAVSDNGAVIGTTATDTYGCMTLPKFSTINQHDVAFIPTLYADECKNIRITASTIGVKETEIFDMSAAATEDATGFRQLEVRLPEAFQNKGWVEIKVYTYFSPEKSLFIMDGYRMKNLLDKDLAVALTGKARGFVGETMTFKATVSNIGISECGYQGGTFTLSDSKGNVIAEKRIESQENIPADESIEIIWDYVPGIKDLGACTVRFELLGQDMNDTNDVCEISSEIAKGKAIVVDDLSARLDADGISLAWSAPEVRNGFESFEDYVPFTTDDNRIGDFVNIWDEDIAAFALSATTDEAAEVLKDVLYKTGFHVYNSDKMNELFGRGALPYATDGSQLLIAFCPSTLEDGTTPSANDWLISPLVKGGTAFSFNGCPISNRYGREIIEICYATEDTDNPDMFELIERVEIGNSDSSTSVEWQNISVTLPDDAKRVALHYVSRDVFGVCVDNIVYTPAGGNVSVTGYKIYRADDKTPEFSEIGNVTTCDYSDTSADRNIVNSYYVVPVLSDGSYGIESNIAVADPSGVASPESRRYIAAGNNEIIIYGYEGEKAAVYTVDGSVIADRICSEITGIKVAPGIYIVNAGNDVAKIMIR